MAATIPRWGRLRKGGGRIKFNVVKRRVPIIDIIQECGVANGSLDLEHEIFYGGIAARPQDPFGYSVSGLAAWTRGVDCGHIPTGWTEAKRKIKRRARKLNYGNS